MVGRSTTPGITVLAAALVILLFLPLNPAAGQGFGEEGDYLIQETYLIELGQTGDARITDTIRYDPYWFDEYGYLFEDNPNLLTRRYRADSNVGELEDFGMDIDSRNATITVTFDAPGLAYRLSGGWTVFGYGGYELVEEGNDRVVLQASWTIANEYSLFEYMGLEEEVVIELPQGAENGAFNQATGAIEYDLAYAANTGGVLENNKTLFIIVFAMVMALSLILLLYVFTHRARAPSAAAAVTPGAPAATAQAPPYAASPQEAQAQAAVRGEEAKAPPRFCKKCGHPRGSGEERFCRKCGAPHV